jgi:cysteinyl-tRNA synthetase
MRDVFLHNTLTREVEKLSPLRPGRVGYYACGPTVYHHAHIGNLRTYVFTDTVRRVLEYAGYEVDHVMNITDVGHMTTDGDEGEDKMATAVAREHRSPREIADHYTLLFLEDLRRLEIKTPQVLCKATDHTAEMIALTERLLARGVAYVTPSGVYFDTAAFPAYGKLARLNLEGQEAGARIEPHPDKKSPCDFALWKLGQPNHVMQWDSPWGSGYPGWHIECSAMSMRYLGETFDVHSGGIDHIPVHHENEIAQSEGATGVPLARVWLHANFLNVGETKISKSLGNFLLLTDLEKRGVSPLSFRWLCFSAKYRAPLGFTDEAIKSAQRSLNGLYDFIRYAPEEALTGEEPWVAPLREQFAEAVCNDLNFPQAIAVVQELVREANRTGQTRVLGALFDFDRVLGLRLAEARHQVVDLPADVRALVAQREAARKGKDWAASDRLRGEIGARGYIVEDTSEGVRVKVKDALQGS